MKLGPNSKPHRNEPGYVCEMKARTGGHVVIYDLDVRLPENREAGAKRWRVQHEPSANGAGFTSIAEARRNMKMLAKARVADDAGILWYVLPAFVKDAQTSTESDYPVARRKPRRPQSEIDADLETFMADPENEPSEAGRAALRRLFGRLS